jgi:hypothetical protein
MCNGEDYDDEHELIHSVKLQPPQDVVILLAA